ncbi:hypothetical protein BROC_01946 [Candidatus Brocadiaceae bacterium]|nr:hypothetical protein BROC_01946 [Candidatus Brocadiaceae bacterium]
MGRAKSTGSPISRPTSRNVRPDPGNTDPGDNDFRHCSAGSEGVAIHHPVWRHLRKPRVMRKPRVRSSFVACCHLAVQQSREEVEGVRFALFPKPPSARILLPQMPGSNMGSGIV